MRTLYFCPVVSASTSFKHIGLLKMHIVAIKKHPPAPMWRFFMAALHNRAGHYIFALWFLSIYLSSFFFPRLLLAAQVGCLPYFDTWCGPRANLECRSERCCTRLAANAGPKKSRQKSPSGHHPTTLSGYIFATKARIDNRKKKLVKQQYLLYMSPQ